MSEKINKPNWKKTAEIKSALGWVVQWRKVLKRDKQFYIWDERDEEAFRVIRALVNAQSDVLEKEEP